MTRDVSKVVFHTWSCKSVTNVRWQQHVHKRRSKIKHLTPQFICRFQEESPSGCAGTMHALEPRKAVVDFSTAATMTIFIVARSKLLHRQERVWSDKTLLTGQDKRHVGVNLPVPNWFGMIIALVFFKMPILCLLLDSFILRSLLQHIFCCQPTIVRLLEPSM